MKMQLKDLQDLQDLTIDGLSKIICNFGKEERIFQSEAQFQFDLAWKLREKFNCKVKLEELTVVLTMENDTNANEKKDSKTKTKIKKIYTDIVLEKDDYRVAIELKYKTSTLQNAQKALFLLNHGAVDLGRYDYLWDVNRIEFLLGKDKSRFIKDGDTMKEPNERELFNKGFAILLTNEKKYWTIAPEKINILQKTHITIDNDFKIGGDIETGKGELVSATLDWKKEDDKYPDCIEGKWREQPIKLNAAYTYQWKEYCHLEDRNGTFKYIIIEATNIHR